MQPPKTVTKYSLFILMSLMSCCHSQFHYCSGFDKAEKTSIYGNALTDSENCLSREGKTYPSQKLRSMLPELQKMYTGSSRQARQMSSKVQSPELTREQLLNYHILASQGRIEEVSKNIRAKRQAEKQEKDSSKNLGSNSTATLEENPEDIAANRPQTCVPDNEMTPARLCKSTFNTTAPMYGVSLTSGEPVTIVQIFPDLLQQVVFEMCDAKECDVLHGECVQTYVPYLFLVIPLGPVTLTGQDYVLVESGCTCRPKFSRPGSEPNPASVIPSF